MGFLVVCFDDGHEETYTTAYPMLKKYHTVAVVGVITSFVGSIWRDWTHQGYSDFQLATLSELREMRADGWEMASHSLTHSPHEWLGQAHNLERLEMTLKESRDWIIRNRLGDGRTFIYPFGATPGNATELVKTYYWLGRSTDTNPPVYHDLPLDTDQRYRLSSYEVEHPLSNEKLAEIRERVQYAKDNPALISLNLHRVTDQPRIYDVTPQELETIVEIITKSDIETTTFENVIEMVWGADARLPELSERITT